MLITHISSKQARPSADVLIQELPSTTSTSSIENSPFSKQSRGGHDDGSPVVAPGRLG